MSKEMQMLIDEEVRRRLDESNINFIWNLTRSDECTIDQAMEKLGFSPEDRAGYAKLV